MSPDPSDQLTPLVPQFTGQVAPRRLLNEKPSTAAITAISVQASSEETPLQPESQWNWFVGNVGFPARETRPPRGAEVVVVAATIRAEPIRPKRERLVPTASQLRDASLLQTLGDDYDGEGSPGFAPATVWRALELSSRISKYYSELFEHSLVPGRLRPGPSGSVDVVWEDEGVELSIKVPPSPGVPSVFGENSGTSERIVRRILGAYDEVAVARWLRGQCV